MTKLCGSHKDFTVPQSLHKGRISPTSFLFASLFLPTVFLLIETNIKFNFKIDNIRVFLKNKLLGPHLLLYECFTITLLFFILLNRKMKRKNLCFLENQLPKETLFEFSPYLEFLDLKAFPRIMKLPKVLKLIWTRSPLQVWKQQSKNRHPKLPVKLSCNIICD